jgi:peptidyl-prolyl cis-trans isomerase C
MRKLIILLAVVLILIPVYFTVKKYLIPKPYALRINNFTMTRNEIETYFQKMLPPGEDTPENRREILDALINKKLILQEAEKEGLQKSKEFLAALQDFYEQLLFKMILDKKSKELGSKVSVTDEEIRTRYQELKGQGLVNKPLNEVYDKIKWQIFREKQTQALNEWLQKLRAKAKIELNEKEILNR